MVRLSDIGDDYYTFDAPNYCAVGKNSGQEYRMGDQVKIKVRRADLVKKQLDFELV
jgi:ribonuclease R